MRGERNFFENILDSSVGAHGPVPRNARFHTRIHIPFDDSEGTYPAGVERLDDVPKGAQVGETYGEGAFVVEIDGTSYFHTHNKGDNVIYVGGIPCAPK